MIEFLEHVRADDLADLRRLYLTTLAAPLDGMWEEIATRSRHREIRSRGQRAGYFCLDDRGRLLQFFVTLPFAPAAEELFAAVVARGEVDGAMVSTADPLLLGLCLDHQKEIRVHTRLYRDHQRARPTFAEGAEASLDLVKAGELDAIAELQRDSLDQDPGE